MSNLIKKVVTGVSTLALAASMLIMPVATVNAASAGEVYKTTDGTVWFITSDMQRRPFTSAGAFLSYGFLSFSQVKEADASVSALSTGSFIAPQDGRIFCATETKASDVSGECSLITGGKKAAFTSSNVFTGQGYSFTRAYYGDSSFLEKTSNIENASAQHRPGTLINNGGTIQLVVNGGLWGTPSMDVFNSWGWNIADVVPANSADVLLTQVGIIPARMAGQLVPSAAVNPGPGPGNGNFDPNGGTQGSINDFDLGSRDETEALEGENDVEIYAVDVDMNDDGPLMTTSVDVWFSESSAGTASTKPWDYFNEVTLTLNGNTLSSMDADSSSDWSSSTNGNINAGNTTREYRMRFASVDGVLPSDDTSKLAVEVSMMNNLDSDDESAIWFVELGQVRVQDESGFSTNENTNFNTNADLEQSFTVGGADEAALVLSDADDDVDAQVVEVSKTSNTNGVHIYSFDVEETNDVDANIEEMTLTFTTGAVTGTTTENTVIRRASLWIDGDKVSQDETVPNGGTTLFDNLDIDIDADETVTIDVQVDLFDTNNGARYAEGTSISVEVTSLDTFTDANGNDEDDITPTGTAVSNTHELRSEGIMLEFVSSSANKTFVADESGEFDQGTFTITFEATAFGADKRLDRSCEEGGADAAGQGVEYVITNAASNSTTCIFTSNTNDTEDTTDTFELDQNSTRTFTLTVIATASANHFAEVSLESVNWGAATNNTNAFYYTFNLNDYKTGPINLIAIP